MTVSHASAVATTVPVVLGTTDAQLSLPTPCAEHDVRGLIEHLYGLALVFAKAARNEPVDAMAMLETPHVTGDWRAGFAGAAARMVEAFDGFEGDRDAETPLGMPWSRLAQVALSEMLVHGWDLAQATGAEFRPDAEVVEEVWRIQNEWDPQADGPPGGFGPKVAVADDAPLMDRLAGRLGRDPEWEGVA